MGDGAGPPCHGTVSYWHGVSATLEVRQVAGRVWLQLHGLAYERREPALVHELVLRAADWCEVSERYPWPYQDLPLTSVLLTALFLQADGIVLMPLVIVAVVVAFVISARLAPAPAAPSEHVPTLRPEPQSRRSPTASRVLYRGREQQVGGLSTRALLAGMLG